MSRHTIPADVRRAVLIESGYRCAVPTCRTILVLDLHHIDPVSEDGPDTVDNLIALCPNCHAMYHRKHIPGEAIRVYKGTIEALSHAFDQQAMGDLLFLAHGLKLYLTADGLLRLGSLISSGLVDCEHIRPGKMGERFVPQLTDKGKRFVSAWLKGNKAALEEALAPT